MVFWPLKKLCLEGESRPTTFAKSVESMWKQLCTCSVFVAEKQGCGALVNSPCHSRSKSHGALWTLFSRLRHCWEAQPGKLEKWVMICWGIWTSRNEVRHGGKRLTGQLVVRNSLKLLEEFQIANEIPNRVSSDHRDTTSTAQFFRQQNSPALA